MRVRIAIGTGLTVAMLVTPIMAQESGDEVKSQIESHKQGQQEILKQLDEIKKLLQTRPAAAAGPNVKDVIINLGANPVRGQSTAKLTLVEFTDYQ